MKNTVKRDLYQEVTDEIIKALEEDELPPWVRPWHGGGPRNAATGRFYSGVNTMLLNINSCRRGYSNDLWLTMNQVNDLGGRVIKGEKATLITYFKILCKKVEKNENNQEKEEVCFPLLRGYWVFNVAQCEDLPESVIEKYEVVTPPPTIEELEDYVEKTEAVIENNPTRAYYSPSGDYISIPPIAQFSDTGSYYSVLFHELVHWTGHGSRCARPFNGLFGDPDYAKEELVAEIGSAALSAQFQLEGKLQHPQYIKSWLRVLRNDKRFIFSASAQARKAVNFVNELTGYEMEEDVTLDEAA